MAACAVATCEPPTPALHTPRATAAITAITTPLAPPAALRFSPRPNRAREIHWRTWGPELFAEARRLHRPICLSLAAVWCHWCHVLDETTLSDPRVIAMLNNELL